MINSKNLFSVSIKPFRSRSFVLGYESFVLRHWSFVLEHGWLSGRLSGSLGRLQVFVMEITKTCKQSHTIP
jgi:hypothetical protein